MTFSAIWFVLLVTPVFSETCDNWGDNYWEHLSTHTPYRVVANYEASPITFDGCTPVKFWSMIRHGTRYPKIKIIKEMHEKLMALRDEILLASVDKRIDLCKEVVQAFENWYLKASVTDEMKLAAEGEIELRDLAERYQSRFPQLFPKTYSSRYEFRTTDKQRTVESQKNFLIGLFGHKSAHDVWPFDFANSDQIIRFYKFCPRWERDVNKNPATLLAKMKFEDSTEYDDMVRDFSNRLGFEEPLSRETFQLIYITCSFETAWLAKKLSPWCAIFTDDELQALEFALDLKYYNKDGYGNPLNYRQACRAAQDLIVHFLSHENPTTSVSFTHSGTILKLLAHFGLYNETMEFDKLNPDRQWRMGKIGGFASNIAFVLYRCGKEEKFLFLHQERVTRIPGCPEEGLCPLSVLLKTHGDSQSCEFDDMCRIPRWNEL